MGFFDTYKDSGGLSYVDAEEKAVLVKNGTPLEVERVFKGEGKFGEKYTMVFSLDGEQRAISFKAGSVFSRDRFFDAVSEYLEQDADEREPVLVKITKSGASFLVVDANAE